MNETPPKYSYYDYAYTAKSRNCFVNQVRRNIIVKKIIKLVYPPP